MSLLVQALSLLARSLPEFMLRGVCFLLGEILFRLPSRRRIVLSNLAHVYPGKDFRELRRLARVNCRRTIEMGAFALVSPGFSRAKVIERLRLADGFREVLDPPRKAGPILFLLPHNTLTEMVCLAPLRIGLPEGSAAAIYRPLDHPKLDAWIKRTRERAGVRLLSRRKGLDAALNHLRHGGNLALLADQSAGDSGILGRIAGRTASLSPLPDILARRTDARVAFLHVERTGFFRAVIRVHLPEPSPNGPATLFAEWLGDRLLHSPGWDRDWLWLHRRWKTQRKPAKRLRLEQKRGFAPDFFPVPSDRSRADRFYLRLPNWLGDVVMALPLVRAIRAGRPDVRLTLAIRPGFAALVDLLGFPRDDLLAADSRTAEGRKRLKERAREFPDTAILFTNSFRGDKEMWTTGAEQRFGILRPGKRRPLLTDPWEGPPPDEEERLHQVELWRRFLRAFGLEEEADFRPAPGGRGSGSRTLGFFCGSENAPEKRWPVDRWRDLADRLLGMDPGVRLELFGTRADVGLTAEIAAGLDPTRVRNLAGKTDLAGLGERLRDCRLAVGNDTGGMHLANALGVPSVVLFGPTNPIRTRPVFDAPLELVRAPDADETGGGTMRAIPTDAVEAAVGGILSAGEEASAKKKDPGAPESPADR